MAHMGKWGLGILSSNWRMKRTLEDEMETARKQGYTLSALGFRV